jgi:hypothetical protein
MWQNQIPICAFCATETRKNTIFTEMLRVLLHNAKIADKYAEFQGKEWVRIPSSAVERVPEGTLFRFL